MGTGAARMNSVDGSLSTQVIIAALNEEQGIGLTIKELMSVLNSSRVLVVDGRSSDRTVEIAKNCGASIVCQDGKGKGDAIAKALQYTEIVGGYVVLTDADFTYPANYIPEMIKILNENPDIGMVCGNRFGEHLEKKTMLNIYYIGNRLLALAHNILNGVSLHDPLTGLRVVRAELLKEWQVRSKGFDIEVELNHHVERQGYTISEVPIKYRRRLGEKKLKLKHGAVILKRIILETIY